MTIGMIPRYFAIEARCIKINNGKHEFKIISTSNKWPSSIHPKQTNKYPDINKKCRGIVRIQNKTMYLLHSYLRVPFSGKVLFSFKCLKISVKKP